MAMRRFTEERGPSTDDEVWLVQHRPVYTLGRAGDPSHILEPDGVPVIHSDRGGQVTYHGPGQAILYVLLDMVRARIGVRHLVYSLEQAVVDLLAADGIAGARRPNAPGVYVDNRKIAALGLRVRRGRSYHGLSLNVQMDLSPFSRIHPCGYSDLEVTQLADLGLDAEVDEAGKELLKHFFDCLDHS